MATITTTEDGASGRYIDLGSPASQDDIGAQTIIIYCNPATQAANIGYYFAKGDATGHGIRVIQNTANNIAVGSGSSTSIAPSKVADVATLTLGTWQHWQVTWDGSLNGSGFKIYIDAGSAESSTNVTNGTVAITSDAANNVFLLNRTGLGRHVEGDVAYIARWNRVLSGAEMTTVRTTGPLDVPSGLILCWCNNQDYSTNAITASARTTQVAGSTPGNTSLGGGTTVSATVGNAVADGVTATLSSGTTISATPGNAVADGITAAIVSTATIVATPGNAVADGVTATITAGSMAFDASYERSSFNPTGSSISGTGDSAIISINPKVQESESGAFGTQWMEPSVDVSGVNGYRPTFRFLLYKSGANGLHGGTGSWQSTRRPMYSTDSGLTWTYFDTAVTLDVGNQWVEFRNSAAFTSNTVRISRSRQISVHQVGDWVAAFAAAHSEFVPTDSAAAFTPTGAVSGYAAQSFIADEFSAQTDSLGATVAVTPLYAGMVNDTALMPLDGSAKRIAVVSCGVHAGEDYAHWSMRGFLDYVMGASAEAQALRRRYKILVYPLINAPGRAGGGWRGSWTQGTAGADDTSRHFDAAVTLDIVIKCKAAITTDLGSGAKDWALDFHGTYFNSWEIISPYTSSILTRFHSLQQTNSGKSIFNTVAYQAGYLVTWLQDTMGVKFGTVLEHGDPTTYSDATIEAYGAAFAPTLATMAGEGAFGIVAEPGNAVAAGITATITAAGTTTISATPGAAAADGNMASVVRKITASPGDALANGAIAALLRIISATPGNAAASGITATISGAGPVTATVARPSADVSNTGWTPSTGGVLYAMLDEVTPDGADYISAASTGSVCTIDLNATAYPGTAVQQLKYRAGSTTGNSVIIRLKDGVTTIRSQTQVLSAAESEYTITLTSGEIAAITSGSLQVEIESA